MGIERGREWGNEQVLVGDPVECDTDARLAEVPAGAVVALSGGNLWEALGRPAVPRGGRIARVVGLDGLDVLITDMSGATRVVAAADLVVARRRLRAGGVLLGPVAIVSNSGRLRGRDVLPRAHPNDGLLEVLSISGLSARQRLIAWNRARSGAHLPHPGLLVSRMREFRVESDGEVLVVSVDGRPQTCLGCTVTVVPDRWQLALPVPTVGER